MREANERRQGEEKKGEYIKSSRNDIIEVSVNIMSELEWTLYFMSSLEIESRVLRYVPGSVHFERKW